MPEIKNVTCDIERGFYGYANTSFSNITIDGPADGESAFKECKNITITSSTLNLRYPCWHNVYLTIKDCVMGGTCRAAFWYDTSLNISGVKSNGIKAVRECKFVNISDSEFNSDEFGWKCLNISVVNSKINSVYAFFESNLVSLKNVSFAGKYSFQYINNLTIEGCYLDTKDAFWHCKNVVVKNSVIKGEYLGWYSENIQFINCKIIGTQPLCYVKGLTLKDCEFIDGDLAFENSEVNGNILGTMISIKNPISGTLTIEKIPQMIVDENSRSFGRFQIIEKEKQ